MTKTSQLTQIPEASAHVPSALAGTPTMSRSATTPSYGMATPPPSHEKVIREPSSELPTRVTPCASIGICQGRAIPIHTSPGTGVRDVETMTMEHKPADLHNPRFQTKTPYHVDKWHALLESNNLLSKYRHVPISLQYGFNAAIKYIVEHEFSVGRYECPFSQQQIEDILGPVPNVPPIGPIHRPKT